jgi:hypothetical protein
MKPAMKQENEPGSTRVPRVRTLNFRINRETQVLPAKLMHRKSSSKTGKNRICAIFARFN